MISFRVNLAELGFPLLRSHFHMDQTETETEYSTKVQIALLSIGFRFDETRVHSMNSILKILKLLIFQLQSRKVDTRYRFGL